jgi:plasmid stabilization system protein ParE
VTGPDRYRVILSRRAAANLRAIFDYIANDSPQNASAMVNRILHAMFL